MWHAGDLKVDPDGRVPRERLQRALTGAIGTMPANAYFQATVVAAWADTDVEMLRHRSVGSLQMVFFDALRKVRRVWSATARCRFRALACVCVVR